MLRNIEVICDGTIAPHLATMMIRDRGQLAGVSEPALGHGRPYAQGTRCALGTRLGQAGMHHAVESGASQQL